MSRTPTPLRCFRCFTAARRFRSARQAYGTAQDYSVHARCRTLRILSESHQWCERLATAPLGCLGDEAHAPRARRARRARRRSALSGGRAPVRVSCWKSQLTRCASRPRGTRSQADRRPSQASCCERGRAPATWSRSTPRRRQIVQRLAPDPDALKTSVTPTSRPRPVTTTPEWRPRSHRYTRMRAQ